MKSSNYIVLTSALLIAVPFSSHADQNKENKEIIEDSKLPHSQNPGDRQFKSDPHKDSRNSDKSRGSLDSTRNLNSNGSSLPSNGAFGNNNANTAGNSAGSASGSVGNSSGAPGSGSGGMGQ